MSQTYTAGTIAKLLLITPRRLQQLAKDGHVPKAERGRYDLVAAVQGYVKYLRDRAIAGDAAAGGEAQDRVRLVKAKADIAEFEARRLEGDLVPAEEVGAALADMVARFRARCLAIPSKAAPMAAAEERPEAVHEIIETFVHEALAELAQTGVESASGAGGDGSRRGSRGGASAEAEDLGVG